MPNNDYFEGIDIKSANGELLSSVEIADIEARNSLSDLEDYVTAMTPVSLNVTENGIYTAPTGVFGYSPVTVDTGVYTGSTVPSNDLGKNGDYYYQISKTRYGMKSVDNSGMTVSPMRILANEFYVTGPFKLTGIRINLSEAVTVKYYVLDNTKTVLYESDNIQGAIGWNEHTLSTPISLVYNQHYIIAANVQDKGTYTQNSYTTWNTDYVIFVRDLYSQTDSIGGLVNDSVTCMVDPVLESDNTHVIAEYVKDNGAWVSISSVEKMILSSLNVTDNGTYTAPAGTAYSSVSVSVSGSGGSQLPSGYTSIDYVECPQSGQAGFTLTNFDIETYDIVETLTMPYQVTSDEAAFAGIADAVEFYYYEDSALTWVDGGSVDIFDFQTRPVIQAYNQYYHKTIISGYFTGNFNIGYYVLNDCVFIGRIYKFKIYRTDDLHGDIALINNFVPCIRNSDNKVGMYDVINSTFYSSTTGTEFVAPSSNN